MDKSSQVIHIFQRGRAQPPTSSFMIQEWFGDDVMGSSPSTNPRVRDRQANFNPFVCEGLQAGDPPVMFVAKPTSS